MSTNCKNCDDCDDILDIPEVQKVLDEQYIIYNHKALLANYKIHAYHTYLVEKGLATW